MSHTRTPAIARPMVRSVVVPANIYTAAMRANSHLMDLLIFSKLRQFCSLEDIAVYCALNDHLAIDATPIASVKMKQIMELGGGNETEYTGILNMMSTSQEIKRLAMACIDNYAGPMSSMLALGKSQGTAQVVKDRSVNGSMYDSSDIGGVLPYQLKTSGSNVFVVVGTGFDKYVGAHRDKQSSMNFVEDFLELCDGLHSPSEVARHPLFKFFLTQLQSV